MKLALRLAPDLHQALVELAESDMRSLNSEINILLREAAEARITASAIGDKQDLSRAIEIINATRKELDQIKKDLGQLDQEARQIS